MDLEEAITVTKIYIQDEKCYLMVGWQDASFEMYLFMNDRLWKGRFSPKRLMGFSKNLSLSEEEYYTKLKSCLTQCRNDYRYEIKGGFFYWKRKLGDDSFLIEGFLPIDLNKPSQNAQPNLIEVLIALNSQLKNKADNLKCKFRILKSNYRKCIKDTEEFLNLKMEMEKSLSDKFLNLLRIQQNNMDNSGLLDKK